MERQEHLDHLAASATRLADAAATAGTDATVPTCPGWTVADLLDHLVAGSVWARTIVEQAEQGITERVVASTPADQPDGAARVDYFRGVADALVATLTEADPTLPAWTFSKADRTVAFWVRRRAQETTIHRYDAETAAGTPTPIDAALAVDGIDEFATVFLPRLVGNLDGFDASVHLHCTDTEGEWLVARRDGVLAVTREHAKGDVAVRGSASDLLLFLWGRVPAEELEVFGDADALARFREGIKV